MKKTAACLAAAAILISLAACSGTAKDDNLFSENNLSATVLQETENNAEASNTASQTTTKTEAERVSIIADESAESSPDIETEEILPKALNSSDYVLNASFTPIYENAGFAERNSDGNPTTYEELQDFIPAYEDISFVEYEIIAQYTPEEAFEKTGDEIFKYSTTLYQAHIYYDYLHDAPVDMIVDLAKASMPDKQFENDPPYAVGQKIIAAVSGYNTTSCVAISELVYYVYEVNGVKLAYHVGNEKIALKNSAFANLDMDLLDSERSVITTTANNPVKFTQKSTVEDLTLFIRQDWEARGYDFFDVANFDYENRSILDTNEDVAVVE